MRLQESASPPPAYAFGAFRLDVEDERLFGPSGPIRLGRRAFRVLMCLLEAEGRLVTKDDLFECVWDNVIVSDSALTSVIKEIRRALGETAGDDSVIETVYGRGYRFHQKAVREAAAHSSAAPARPRAPAAAEPPAAPHGEAPLLFVADFNDIAIRGEQPHLAAVLREEMLFALSRFTDTRLVAGRGFDADEMNGASFGKRDYRIDITFGGRPGATRILPRLSRLADGRVIWSDRLLSTGEDTGAMIDDMVVKIVGAVLPQVERDLIRDLPAQPADVYDEYFALARRHRILATHDEAKRAFADWEGLIDRHPTFTRAYPKLVRLLNTDYEYTALGGTGPDERTRARALAMHALALDPMNAHLWVIGGWCALWAGDKRIAARHLSEAVRLNGFNAVRLLEAATGFLFIGDLDHSARLLDDYDALAPFPHHHALEERGLLHLLRGEYEAADELLALIEAPSILACLYRMLAAEGRGTDEAARIAAHWRESVAAHWHAAEAPSTAALLGWIDTHNPFQDAALRKSTLALAERALTRV